MKTVGIQWTKPYCGVQHVNLPHRNNQITLVQYSDRLFVVYQLNLKTLHPFTSVREEKTKTLEAAREYGEKWARECL